MAGKAKLKSSFENRMFKNLLRGILEISVDDDLRVVRGSKRRMFICVVAIALYLTARARAQFSDPRLYSNTPVKTNQLEFAYSHARSDTSIDTSEIVAGAKLNLNEGTVGYTRYFNFFHRLAWAKVDLPSAGLQGEIPSADINASVVGLGDSAYQIAILLKGGPALTTSQFANYKPASTIGVSLTMTAPTGQYDPDKILNLGEERWSFKPEAALSKIIGPEQKWELDTYANAYLYSDNTSYHRIEILRQDPLLGLEGHLSRAFSSGVWAALDTRYSFHGGTFVNGVNQNDAQQNFILGGTVNVPAGPQGTLVFELAGALVHHNGPSITALVVKYDYAWGK